MSNDKKLFLSALDAIGSNATYEEWAVCVDGGEFNKALIWSCAEEAEAMISEARDASNYTFTEYQAKAARTIDFSMRPRNMEDHALHGMVGEIGELHSIYQKVHQGHEFDDLHAEKEVGDLLWFVAEYCTVMGWSMGDVAELNIEKLRNRYPKGFEAERSLHREEGDI